jgi:hypothetical protein
MLILKNIEYNSLIYYLLDQNRISNQLITNFPYQF